MASTGPGRGRAESRACGSVSSSRIWGASAGSGAWSSSRTASSRAATTSPSTCPTTPTCAARGCAATPRSSRCSAGFGDDARRRAVQPRAAVAPPRPLRAGPAPGVLRAARRRSSTTRKAAGRACAPPVDLQLANSNWTADQIFASHRPPAHRAARRREPRGLPSVPRPEALPVAVQRRATARVEGHRHDSRGGRAARHPRRRATRARTSTSARSGASTRPRACSRSAAGSRGSASPASKRSRAARRSSPPTTAAAASTRSTARPRSSSRPATRARWPTPCSASSTTTPSPRRLVANGLEVVERDFDWEQRTDEFAAVLDGLCADPAPVPPPTRPPAPAEPELSVVVLAWDNLLYTQQFADSVRRNTDVPYELVDRRQRVGVGGGELRARRRRPVVLNPTQPRVRARDEPGSRRRARALRRVLQQRHDPARPTGPRRSCRPRGAHPNAAIVVPAVTNARNQVNVRAEPGDKIEVLPPFSAPPAAIVYVMPAEHRARARRVGRGVRDRER